MKRSRLVLAALAGLALIAWRGGALRLGADDPDPTPGGGNRADEPAGRTPAGPRARSAAIPSPQRPDGAVTISGTVLDASTHAGVGGVEVVFRGPAGEETTVADPDGRYRLDVPPGAYRAFVRDDTVLSVARADQARLPGLPNADAAGAPDEALMPVVAASADTGGVDLTVTRGGVVRGKVVDRAGRPIASAVLRAVTEGLRPTLGTDVAETGSDGGFELRLPAGAYDFAVSHARFAGIASGPDDHGLVLEAGETVERTFTLAAGCVIAGRVVTPDGRPAGDGAIELRWGEGTNDFTPAGRIAADGTFRWTTTDEAEIVLRAWPWKAPPSQALSFACRDGARYEGAVFTLQDRRPDVDGLLVDARGAPVPHAYIDLAPLAPGGMAQQERTDEHGRWSVYQLPAGAYQVTAYAAGRGVVAAVIEAPGTDVRLALGGTGRIEGKTPRLASGSFRIALQSCDREGLVQLPAEHRLVTVTDHQFSVEDVPACNLSFVATWRDLELYGDAEVPADGVARIELDVGPPREKLVRGTVKDEAGRPAAGVTVEALFDHGDPARAVTDADGRYTLRAAVGVIVHAHKVVGPSKLVASQVVTEAEGDEETIDLELVDATSPELPVGDMDGVEAPPEPEVEALPEDE